MTVKEDILQLIREHGGEFRAPGGDAGRQIAQKTGHSYNNVSTTLYRLTQRGVLEKIGGGPRRSHGYHLLRDNGHDALSHIPELPSIPTLVDHTPPTSLDQYDELAAALLRRLVAVEEAHRQGASESRGAFARLQEALDTIQDLRGAVAQRTRQTLDLEQQLVNLQAKLTESEVRAQALENELAAQQGRYHTIRDRLPEETRKELERMMRERPVLQGED